MSRLKKIAEAGIKARVWQEPETESWTVQPEGCIYFGDGETAKTLGIALKDLYRATSAADVKVFPHPMDQSMCFENEEDAQKVADNINKMLGL